MTIAESGAGIAAAVYALATLALGAVLGPEAPLILMGSGLGVLASAGSIVIDASVITRNAAGGGNIAVSWSWFGTNQLGIGMHAYGASERSTAMWLLTFGLTQLAIIGATENFASVSFTPICRSPSSRSNKVPFSV